MIREMIIIEAWELHDLWDIEFHVVAGNDS
jgi:hypothetical protein